MKINVRIVRSCTMGSVKSCFDYGTDWVLGDGSPSFNIFIEVVLKVELIKYTCVI